MNEKVPDRATGQSTAEAKRINCLIVVPSLMRSGAETQAVDLANGLAERGHSIHLCSFERQLDQRIRVSDKVQFHHLLRRSKYDLSVIGRLAAIIDREEIEIVQGVLQIATLVAWLAARRSNSRPPVVAALHTTVNRDLKQELFDRILYRRLLRRLPAVVFVCEHQRDYWISKYPELSALSTAVYNGVAPDRYRRNDFQKSARQLRAELCIPDDATVFACIAEFRPEKGHKILIEAYSRLRGHAYLALAGEGELQADVEASAEVAGVKEHTRFLGNIPDVRPLIAASNATVLASTAVETFSIAMLESMAMGVPMIAPRIGGLPEAIVDGETGLLFEIGHSSALSSCMQHVLDNPSEARRMGREAERMVTEAFTLDKMVSGTEQVLRDALSAIGKVANLTR